MTIEQGFSRFFVEKFIDSKNPARLPANAMDFVVSLSDMTIPEKMYAINKKYKLYKNFSVESINKIKWL